MIHANTSSRLGIRSATLIAAAIAFFATAPPQAHAQDEATTLETTSALFACQMHRAIFAMKESLCAESEFACTPSVDECSRLCEVAAYGCRKAGRATAKASAIRVRAQMQALRVLCQAAGDPRPCRKYANGWRKFLASEKKTVKDQLTSACGSPELEAACNEACNGTVAFGCADEPPFIWEPPGEFELRDGGSESGGAGAIIIAVGLDETLVLEHSGEDLVLRGTVRLDTEGAGIIRVFESQAELDAILAQQAKEED